MAFLVDHSLFDTLIAWLISGPQYIFVELKKVLLMPTEFYAEMAGSTGRVPGLEGPRLGFILCCCHLETLDALCTRPFHLHFSLGPTIPEQVKSTGTYA